LTKVVSDSNRRTAPPMSNTKFVPFTVSVNTVAPTILFVGEMLVVVGRGLFTVKIWALDVHRPWD